ncbi:xanthine phosphoribosyltransferase [Salipaludibacillus keqinensis]|uniref:Xanthine phosphoribosyltransferase n=1 Tax=Salipaludibacillus keqinensis TaxID=2045207 RepID=A0A323TIP5_9BACI|nr:xanthine phosphoribosyltransferase [Salipaludibacillus keqinensis]PYZ94420.1 xanthine phosphoribosyltransferase [Salipaludibacillus keqinensis]
MELIEQFIVNEGKVINEQVLKVDSFLNHAIHPKLMKEIGNEFAERFKNDHSTKILTLESSGIAPALMTALALNCELVFARKRKSITMTEDLFTTTVHSYTKNTDNEISVSRNLLKPSDRVLIIDDFLANGQAALGLIDLVHQAGASVTGLGIVIEKSFQPGRQILLDKGYKIESLARISSLSNKKVTFANQLEEGAPTNVSN